MIKQLLVCLIGSFVMESTKASTFSLPDQGNVVGTVQTVLMKKGQSLIQIAQQFDIGVTEILEANPKIKLSTRYNQDKMVIIPSEYSLPSGPREGLVINLAELRIYYFHPDEPKVSTYPIAIGKRGWSTPQGITEVKGKEKNPAWRPTPAIHREAARRGYFLPAVLPAGPRNPLGRYVFRLGISGILIHGTTQPASIGLPSSHGCIRLYPKNIEELFLQVPVGTSVRIVHEPVKKTAWEPPPNPPPSPES